MSKFSENEDDPQVYESSGDEWNSANEKKGSNRRTSQRLSKKPRIQVVDPGSSSDDSSEEETPRKRKPKNGVTKKQKPSAKEKVKEELDLEKEDSDFKADTSDSNSNAGSETKSTTSETKSDTKSAVPVSRGIHRKFIPKTIFSEDYATGSFVILKKDAQVGDPSKHPCIWRIDGKALLQKYEAFDDDGKVRHKNTSIYTGWSPMDKDLYAPVTVDVIHHNNQNLTVELHWEKLKEVNIDSE